MLVLSLLLLLLGACLSGPAQAAANSGVVCRGVSASAICPDINGFLTFSDGCNRCECKFGRGRCSRSQDCPLEGPEDKQACDAVREVVKQKQIVRPPCLTPELVCPQLPGAIFYQNCNRCRCVGAKEASCNDARCPDNVNYTNQSYRMKCRRQRQRVLGSVSDEWRYLKRALYI